jgi:hypothetical protein
MFDQVTPVQEILKLKRTGSQPVFTSSMLHVVACAIIYSSLPHLPHLRTNPPDALLLQPNLLRQRRDRALFYITPEKHGDFVETVDLHVTGVSQYRRWVVNN